MMFAGLMADVLNGDVVDSATVGAAPADDPRVFAKARLHGKHDRGALRPVPARGSGFLSRLSSATKTRSSSSPCRNKDIWPKVKDKMRILYPVPTVWSSHPFISLSARASKLMEALKDPEIQKIAWEQHGFRTGLVGPRMIRLLQVTGNSGYRDKGRPHADATGHGHDTSSDPGRNQMSDSPVAIHTRRRSRDTRARRNKRGPSRSPRRST